MQIRQQKEQVSLKANRAYFEFGCSCIHTSKTLQPCPNGMADDEAVAFYEKNCKCSRNYSNLDLLAENESLRALLAAASTPVAWQARFTEPGQKWGYCSKEHHDFVKTNPGEWPGYEVRELFAAPQSKAD